MAGRLRPALGQPAADSRLVRLGPPLRPAPGRLGIRGLAPQGRAGRLSFTCRCTRTGPARWKATTTATTGPTAPSPSRIAGRSSRPPAQIAEHIQARRWTETLFQGFLNNKNNFKERGWSRGSSPWLLDEPASFQDYWALRYFARAFHEGINQAVGRGSASDRRQPSSPLSASSPQPRLVFRADISRPAMAARQPRRPAGLPCGRRRDADLSRGWSSSGSGRLGEIVLEYGSTNPIEGSNVQPVGWCLDAWSLGADGILPWQTVGTADSWEQADELALVLSRPGRQRQAADSNAARRRFPRSGSRRIAAASRTSST